MDKLTMYATVYLGNSEEESHAKWEEMLNAMENGTVIQISGGPVVVVNVMLQNYTVAGEKTHEVRIEAMRQD